jgi:hypothetical protein
MPGESTEQEIKLKRITIKTEAGTRWFATADDFIRWAQQQMQLYDFLRNKMQNQHNEHQLHQRLQQAWTQLQQFVQNQLKPVQSDVDQYAGIVDKLASEFQTKLSAKQIFTSEAPFADFVAQLLEQGDFLCAAATVAHNLGENLTNYDLALASAFQRTLDWERGALGKAESETHSLFNLRESWDEELTRQTNNADNSQERLDTLTARADKLLEGQRKRFDKNVGEYNSELNSAVDNARQELDAITQTYEENLALHAPVRYWGLQEKYHRRKVILFAIVTVVAAVMAIGGLVTFAWYVLDQKVGELIIGKLVTMAVLTTFAIWAVRLCSNLFMSHNHLHTDAQERRTMIHTYLALLRKKNALKEDERQLILQTLFRPNTTGMIKEDSGPAHLVDLINRMAPKGHS